jgi:hypothetical protein
MTGPICTGCNKSGIGPRVSAVMTCECQAQPPGAHLGRTEMRVRIALGQRLVEQAHAIKARDLVAAEPAKGV